MRCQCLREAAALRSEQARHQEALRLNSKHRQDVSELQAERDSLRERVQEKSNAIRVLESNLETSQLCVGNLETRLSELEVAERAKETTIHQLRADNEALSARSVNLEQQREQLAQRCATLQAEKDELDRKCKKLEEEVDRLRFVDAMNDRLRTNNEQLRTNIELIERASELQCAATRRESEASIRAIRNEAQARLNFYQEEIQMLKVKADAQHDVVEQEARAWQRKWMKEKEANDAAKATEKADPKEEDQKS